MWLLGYAVDAAAQGDLHHGSKNDLALMMVALDQSVVDNGDWTVAFLAIPGGRPAAGHVFGQDKLVHHGPFRKAFSGAWYLRHNGPQWCWPTSRRWRFWLPRNQSPRRDNLKSCRPRQSIAEEKSKVPKASKGRSGRSKGTVKCRMIMIELVWLGWLCSLMAASASTGVA